MKKVFSVIVAVIVIAGAIMRFAHGTKVGGFKGNSDVYYKSGVTKGDAEKVGHTLEKIGWFKDQPVAVQFAKENGKYVYGFAVKDELAKDADAAEVVARDGMLVDGLAFAGAPFQVQMIDAHFNVLKTMDPPNLGAATAIGDGYVFYKGGATDKDADAVGNFIQSLVGKDTPYCVALASTKAGNYTLTFPLEKAETAKDPKQQNFYSALGAKIGTSVLKGAQVQVVLATWDFQPLNTLPVASAQQGGSAADAQGSAPPDAQGSAPDSGSATDSGSAGSAPDSGSAADTSSGSDN